jgi:hypothetical protein
MEEYWHTGPDPGEPYSTCPSRLQVLSSCHTPGSMTGFPRGGVGIPVSNASASNAFASSAALNSADCASKCEKDSRYKASISNTGPDGILGCACFDPWSKDLACYDANKTFAAETTSVSLWTEGEITNCDEKTERWNACVGGPGICESKNCKQIIDASSGLLENIGCEAKGQNPCSKGYIPNCLYESELSCGSCKCIPDQNLKCKGFCKGQPLGYCSHDPATCPAGFTGMTPPGQFPAISCESDHQCPCHCNRNS